MRFPQEFIERVSEASNIVDIISQYTQLKPTGSGLMGRCPFPDHREKTASFSVSEAKQVYHCFGCHKSGNIFSFLRDYQGMNFPDAVEYLAGRANLPMPRLENRAMEVENKVADRKKALLRANRLAHDFFLKELDEQSADHPVKKYIHRRGLDPETLKAFHIGYAPADWEGLTSYLVSNGISTDVAEEARLIKARKEGRSGYFDLFRDRLMFPILSTMGDVLAFGGRIIETGEPKYLNSPETPVFIKGRVLYGLEQTARYIRSEDVALIVEGYMDLVSLFQSGIQNVAATMGTALTFDHCRVIKRMTRNVVVLFDGDSAGVEAAERSLPILLSADIFPKGLTLPDNMDPDDFVKSRGSIALKEMIEKAPDLFSSVLDKWLEDYRGEASQKIKLIDKVKPILEVIPDFRLRDLYISELSQKMTVPLPWLRNSLSAKSSPASANRKDFNHPTQPGVSKPIMAQKVEENSERSASPQEPNEERILLRGASHVELVLLNLVLKSHANVEFILAEQISSQLPHAGVRQLLEKTEQIYRQEPNRFDRLTSQFVTMVDAPELLFIDVFSLPGSSSKKGSSGINHAGASVVSAATEFDSEAEQKLLRDCCRKIRNMFLKEKARGIALEIKAGNSKDPGQDESVKSKLEQLMNIQRDRHSLNKN